MDKIRLFLLLSMLCGIWVTTAAVAETISTLTQRQNLIIPNQQVYYPGDRLEINYHLPVEIHDLLTQANLHVVVTFPDNSILDVPLELAVTGQAINLFEIEDVSGLPAGEYYLDMILTQEDKGALNVGNWFYGSYGRIDSQRIKISATTTDVEDKNKDQLIDGDFNGDGLADPPLNQAYLEDVIQFNQHVYYPGDRMEISYTLPDRLSDLFAGRANAFMLITSLPNQQTISFPLPALNPDQNVVILDLADLSGLAAGDYLASVVFTHPGGDPLLLADWRQDILVVSNKDRIRITQNNSDPLDSQNRRKIDGDTNNDGLNDIAMLNNSIRLICNNDLDCLFNALPLKLSLSVELASLMDILCAEDQACVTSLTIVLNGNAPIDTDNILTGLCATNTADCLQAKTPALVKLAQNIVNDKNLGSSICSGLNNTDCNDFLLILADKLRAPLFSDICRAGECGVNGGFLPIVANETEFQKLLVDICQYDLTCENDLIANADASIAELDTLFCTTNTINNCTTLVTRYAGNNNRYFELLDQMCDNSDLCSELIGQVAALSSAVLERDAAIDEFCQGDSSCIKDTLPALLESAANSVNLDDVAYFDAFDLACPATTLSESEQDACFDVFDNHGFIFNTLVIDDGFIAALDDEGLQLF